MQSKEKYFALPNQSLNDIPLDVEHLYFSGYGKQNELTELNFSSCGFSQLKSITIGNECFKFVRTFLLDGLDQLESVKVGESCFRYGLHKEEDDDPEDGLFQITNCPKLCDLEIGYQSFDDYRSFVLSNVESLTSIKFGDECFYYADHCILKGE